MGQRIRKMFHKGNFVTKLLLVPILIMLNGCVYMVIGGIGAVGGYIVSPDTVEGYTEHSFEDVWTQARDVASVMGTIEEEYAESGQLVARVAASKVTITIYDLGSSTVRLRVKARKFLMPRIRTAQDVYVKIINSLD